MLTTSNRKVDRKVDKSIQVHDFKPKEIFTIFNPQKDKLSKNKN